eukprot:3460971-Amphidinium_carterae.1
MVIAGAIVAAVCSHAGAEADQAVHDGSQPKKQKVANGQAAKAGGNTAGADPEVQTGSEPKPDANRASGSAGDRALLVSVDHSSFIAQVVLADGTITSLELVPGPRELALIPLPDGTTMGTDIPNAVLPAARLTAIGSPPAPLPVAPTTPGSVAKSDGYRDAWVDASPLPAGGLDQVLSGAAGENEGQIQGAPAPD